MNALRYTGMPLQISWQNPFTPIIFSTLFRFGLEDWIPSLGPAYLIILLVAFLTLGYAIMGKASVYAALLLVANQLILTQALMIGNDIGAICFGIIGLLALSRGLDRPVFFYLSFVSFALSYSIKPSIFLLLPACFGMALFYESAKKASNLVTIKWLFRNPSFWRAIVCAMALLILLQFIQFSLAGVWWASSTLGRPIGPSIVNLPYYAFSSISSYSIPVTLLMAAGAWLGLSNLKYRKITTGLIVAILTAFIFISCIYSWRSSRLVLYWIVPGILLAGIAIERVPRLAGLVLLAFTLFWSNSTTNAYHDQTPTILWAPNRGIVMDYSSGAIRSAPVTADLFSSQLNNFLERRRREMADDDRDDFYYSRPRSTLGYSARYHINEGELLYLHLKPNTRGPKRWVYKYQLVLQSRRVVEAIHLDESLPSGKTDAWVFLEVAEAERLATQLPAHELISKEGRYALIRIFPHK